MAYRTALQIGPPVSMGTTTGMGCGCAGLGCSCSQSGGLGLFDSGMDFSAWGIPEWSIVAVGAYALLSLVGDTKRGARRVKAVAIGGYKGARSARRANPSRRRRARR